MLGYYKRPDRAYQLAFHGQLVVLARIGLRKEAWDSAALLRLPSALSAGVLLTHRIVAVARFKYSGGHGLAVMGRPGAGVYDVGW